MGIFDWLRRGSKRGKDQPSFAPPISSEPEEGFAVIDIETTGFGHSQHRIVEIAVVRTDPKGRLVDEWTTLLNPEGPVGATRVHGIRQGDVKDAPRFADIIGELTARLAGRAIVAHNARFDLAFVGAEFARSGYRMPDAPVLCTLEASHYYLPNLNRRRLINCCWAVGIELKDEHSALGDARATAGLVQSYLSGRCGVAPDPDHVVLPSRAVGVPWPQIPPRLVMPTPRRGVTVAVPAPPWRIAALLDDLPLTTAVDDWAPSSTTAYVELLAEVLEDRVLTTEEAESLAELAGTYGLSREQVEAAHRGFLLALAHKAIEDGTITAAERQDLAHVAKTLALDAGIVQSVLDEAAAAFAIAQSYVTKPVPESWDKGEPLRAGDRVAFTGCDEAERARLEAKARAAGLRVTSSVSRLTAVLVTDGANRNTRKAVAAREYGTRIVSPGAFAQLLEHVQPALETGTQRASATSAKVPEPRAPEPAAATRVDPSAVRAWARANGLPVGVRGRIPADVLEKYRAAHTAS